MVPKYILLLVSIYFVQSQRLFSRKGDNTCSLNPQTGLCKAYIPSFYYDPENKICDCFVYTGCGGNHNRFEAIEDCMQACGVTPNDQRISDTCRTILSGMKILDNLLEKFENHRIPDIDIRLIPGLRPGSTGSTKNVTTLPSTPSIETSINNRPFTPSSVPPFKGTSTFDRPSSSVPPFRGNSNTGRPFSSRPPSRDSGEDDRRRSTTRSRTESTREDRPFTSSSTPGLITGNERPLFPSLPPVPESSQGETPFSSLPPLPPPPPIISVIKDIKPSSVPSFFQSAKHPWQS